MHSLDIGVIAGMAGKFRERLEGVKASLGRRDFEWYPYGSLANFDHFNRLLTGRNRFLLDLAGNDPALDVGCADGDLSFFLESLGLSVEALDHPVPNHSAMAGVRLLRQALNSSVSVHVVDLDAQFALPSNEYGLVFLLGVLYHLKNPFFALEKLSRHARYCLMSTRIAATMPGIKANVRDIPAAYLLDANELNADDSNFWIFTEAGFRRLLRRTNWDVLDFLICGHSDSSDPITTTRDERVFCLARSCYGLKAFELLSGWHEPEGGGWRWTEKRFSIGWTRREGAAAPSALALKLYVAPVLLERRDSVILSATVNGVRMPDEIFRAEGDYVYQRRIPPEAASARELRLEFGLDDALPPGDDPRERGIVVNAIELM